MNIFALVAVILGAAGVEGAYEIRKSKDELVSSIEQEISRTTRNTKNAYTNLTKALEGWDDRAHLYPGMQEKMAHVQAALAEIRSLTTTLPDLSEEFNDYVSRNR